MSLSLAELENLLMVVVSYAAHRKAVRGDTSRPDLEALKHAVEAEIRASHTHHHTPSQSD